MKTETKLLLQQCRDALLQQRDEQIAALLTQWFEGMIGEEDMEEDLDDLCPLLHYRVQSRGSQRSYATYTSWWEGEGALQPSEGTFLCADVPSLRQRLLEMSPRQLDLVVELAYQVRARGAELEGEARPSTGHAGLREMATWLAQVRPSALVERRALPPAPRPIERQEERRQREQEQAAQACQQGYLVLLPDTPQGVSDTFRHWCKEHGQPTLWIDLLGWHLATLRAQTKTVGWLETSTVLPRFQEE